MIVAQGMALAAIFFATFAAPNAIAQGFPNRPITLIVPWPAGGSTDMQKVDWDPLRDFTYVIGVSDYTFGVVVNADSAFRSFNDLIAYAKANPGKMSYGSTGTGTSPHLLMEDVAAKAGVQLLHVPFKGNADSTQALMGSSTRCTGTGRARTMRDGPRRPTFRSAP
jgi:tripartite-type tricarboxylate transporter receptor subunit TctC